jgi:predicted exporter
VPIYDETPDPRPVGPTPAAGRPRVAVLALWLALLLASAWQIARTPVSADITAFLPPSVSRTQQLLIDQLRDGVASRLLLIGVEGDDADKLAVISRDLARRLRATQLFSYVNNGEAALSGAERDLLMTHRYLLSPAVTPERFTAAALREALENDLRLLASPLGAMIKPTLPADPTGEWLHIATALSAGGGPASRFGVWFAEGSGGGRALLLAETLAPGFDADRQQQALDAVRAEFAAAAAGTSARLLLSGAGVFTATSRAIIEQDAWRLSLIAGVLVVLILYTVYRSARVVVLGLLPVLSGLLVGAAAVGLGFGMIHGITLGFGATLIGEAVDYPSYLFIHVARGEKVADTLQRIGPTLRLAVLTTVFGALAMLLSSFTGLSQLGLLAMVGVLAAGLVTRRVLPLLAPTLPAEHKLHLLPPASSSIERRLQRGRWLAWLALLAAVALIAARQDRLWDDDLANLNPIAEEAKRLDGELRRQLGALDVRHLVIARGATQDQALARSEEAAATLDKLVQDNVIAGYELAASFLPSTRTQTRRRAALPDDATLHANLTRALDGLPFQDGVFEPFLRDVAQARVGKPVELDDLRGSALDLKVRSLLLKSGGEWIALVPLRSVANAEALAGAFASPASSQALPPVFLLDLKEESNRLVNGYRNESLRLIGLGLLAILAVLAFGLRDATAVGRVLLPPVIAVAVTVACLLLAGRRLNLFHLVSLLLVIGIGLNYALFFHRPEPDVEKRRLTRLALLVCSLTTLSAFGALAFSGTPVLHAIGMTVALGTVLSLLVAAMLAREREG